MPTFVSDEKYISLTFGFRFILLVKRKQDTQYLGPNLSEKILHLVLHASIFDPVRLFATVRL